MFNGNLWTSLHVKPTDCHQYLQFQSSHPKHTKMSIVYSQTLTVGRACSQEEDYKNYCNQMKSWFLKRSYPEHLIHIEMKKVKFKLREKTEKSKLKGVLFVETYHPSPNCLHKIIRDNTYLLYMNEEVKNLFFPGPMVSFRDARKLSSHRGFLNDVSVTLIDKTDGSDPKKREDYWMKTLKIMAPYELNIEDSV